MKKILYPLITTCLLSSTAFAATPTWKLIPNESNITFSATQNSAPVTGSFKKFTGTIQFNPAQPNTSNIRFVVDMNSVTISFADAAELVKSADWFDVKKFPEGIFTSSKISLISNDTYQAQGTLTLRDKTQPLTITFNTRDLNANKEQATGSFTIKRTDFGIGQGEWSNTDAIKDDVKVDFVMVGKKG